MVCFLPPALILFLLSTTCSCRCRSPIFFLVYKPKNPRHRNPLGPSQKERREREREMEGISHRTVAVNGINMHIAEKGDGPIVLFIHGFPELWYSWRHQILALASRGYHAVAPDLRGYVDTDAPPSSTSYTMFHLVGDMVALIDALGQDQVFVVGHDWGAIVAWNLCMFRPDKVKALVNMSVVHSPRNPAGKPIDYLRAVFGDDFYILRIQEPGAMETLFNRLGTEHVLKKFFAYHSTGPLYISKEFGDSAGAAVTLPSWLTRDDINYYTSRYEKSGFGGGYNYYRCLNLNWELTAPWTGAQIKVPVKFIIGDQDLTYYYPGTKDFIHKGGLKKAVPLLEEVVVMEGAGHFIIEERATEITEHILDFIQKVSSPNRKKSSICNPLL